MKMMKFCGALAIGSLFVLTAGCGKSKALESAEEYEKASCACTDATCITNAAKKFSDRAQDMASAKSSEAEAITKATSNATACAVKISMAGVPGMPGAPKH